MATFTVNQVRHLFVSTAYKASLSAADAEGTISVGNNKDDIYFYYRGVDGIVRSDLMSKSSITSGKATSASSMSRPLKKHKITLDPSVNGGAPVPGQEYLLRIVFDNWIGVSPEDKYQKYGFVVATPGMTASNFYKELKKSLEDNFSKEPVPMFKFSNTMGTGEAVSDALDLIIEEVEQPWIIGRVQSVSLTYTIQTPAIRVEGMDLLWGLVKKEPSTSFIGNGKQIADMEYFYMGSRGDNYRMMGFPNVINTKYLVNPTLEYNTIDLHYSYAGSGTDVQKSEKDITLVIPAVGGTVSAKVALTNSIAGAINTAYGSTLVALLPTT